MDLQTLEKLIDETNTELLAGSDTPIHLMDKEQLQTFIKRQERLYKACIQIRLQKSVKKFKVGLNFEDYKKQQEAKEEKKNSKASADAKTKKTSQKKISKAGFDMGNLLGDILSMSKNWCKVHNQTRAQCGCVEETTENNNETPTVPTAS